MYTVINRQAKNNPGSKNGFESCHTNRKMLSKMIGGEFEVLEAENGRECLEKLKEYGTGILLVLLDIIMPEMNGLEVLSEMNRLHYSDDIPV